MMMHIEVTPQIFTLVVMQTLHRDTRPTRNSLHFAILSLSCGVSCRLSMKILMSLESMK